MKVDSIQKKKYSKKYKICVVGAGHVGLVAAACFAELGHKVICVDNDSRKIQSIKCGNIPFYEPDLESLVKKGAKSKTLSFSSSLPQSIRNSEVIFIAVGTPPQDDGSADLTSIENVARVVAKNLNSYKLIVEKSTVPVRTGKKVKETIFRYKKNDVDFEVASNPEFLREGKAIYDFFFPDRIVVGVESEKAESILREIYASLQAEVIVTDINTAELIKHASNSFLAAKISFINAVSRVCDLAGADVTKVALAMGLDKRIGKEFLEAGIGYGGFCFPKDVEAFMHISGKVGYDFGLLKEVKKVNDAQKGHFIEKIKEHLWVLKNKKIAVLGLSFKPDTDDIRFAPSLDIINFFLKEGALVSLYDPQAKKTEIEEALYLGKRKNVAGIRTARVKFVKSSYEALKGCDCACFLTEWAEFKKMDLKKVKKLMHYPFIADGRNMLDREKVAKAGIEYIGMGR